MIPYKYKDHVHFNPTVLRYAYVKITVPVDSLCNARRAPMQLTTLSANGDDNCIFIASMISGILPRTSRRRGSGRTLM